MTSAYLERPLRSEAEARRDRALADARWRFNHARQDTRHPNPVISANAFRAMRVARRQIALLKVGFSLACTSPDYVPRLPTQLTVRDIRS